MPFFKLIFYISRPLFLWFISIFNPLTWLKLTSNFFTSIKNLCLLNRLKKETCQFLNAYYGVNTFKPDDYAIKISFFSSGFYIFNVNTKYIIAANSDLLNNAVNLYPLDIKPVHIRKELYKQLGRSFKVKDRITVVFKNGFFDKAHHTVNLAPLKTPSKSIRLTPFHGQHSTPIFIDVMLTFDSNYMLSGLAKEVYDLEDMYGNRISWTDYPVNYPVGDILNAIVYEEMAKDPQTVEILPELVIPSAYDFTADEFSSRLLLVEMMALC